MRYFDAHSHYYDDRFDAEAEKSADELIGALLSSTVSHIINVGTSPATSRLAIAQAKKHENMYTAIGIHPGDSKYIECDPDTAIADIKSLILDEKNKCVALGEIGLDYHYPDTDADLQMYYFRAQMQLARELSLPVVLHDREAHGAVMEVVRDFPDVTGVMHSYSGSCEMAEELISLGYMISFSGTLTFKNARKTPDVAAMIPRERAMIETDAPYLAPHPHRGELNHSGLLSYTNARLAEIWNVSEEECARITCENARRFFGVK
ncbi:MAG: TatD family hydrolase [Clostridia bacterium]|nr:TatD family hydrolase [Clostridia bacterium]